MKITVLYGYGLNCEKETAFAFEECARKLGITSSIDVKIVHLDEVINDINQLKYTNILAIPGGFSYGDDTGAGNAFSLRIKNNFWHEFQEFLSHDKLVIGICNGCQILTRLIVDFAKIALINNDSNSYQCRWIRVKTNKNGNSVWLRDLDELYIPVAHGEGKFFMSNNTLDELVASNGNALYYVDKDGNCAGLRFPDNPNGSVYDIAALSDRSGRILALMPHPERAIFFTQRDDCPLIKERYKRLGNSIPQYGDGMGVFENGLKYFL